MCPILFLHAMDLRAIRYFVETVRQQSFTLAAERLHVTQSTVSKMVRQLEQESGQPLLVRTPGRLIPTDAGRAVFTRGEQALSLMQALQQELTDLQGLGDGLLCIGIPPMVNALLAQRIHAYRSRYPGVRLDLREVGGDVMVTQLAGGELEVGVAVLPLADEAQSNAPLVSQEIDRHAVCLVASKHATWVGHPQASLAQLHRQPVLLPAPGFALRRLLDERWRRMGVKPELVLQSNQWDFLLSMAVAGLGTAVLPQPLLARMRLPPHVVVRALPTQELEWTVAHLWARDRYLSHAARAWLTLD